MGQVAEAVLEFAYVVEYASPDSTLKCWLYMLMLLCLTFYLFIFRQDLTLYLKMT